MKAADFLIVGGGIMGLSVARELARKFPDAKTAVLEKEDSLARHASGRNSGVLHAGFYYSADSLKARFCVEGNRLMTGYCLDRGLKVNRCGKVVVARNEHELDGLHELKRRGERNGVELTLIDEKELAGLEPNARTYQEALYCPATSTVDPVEVVSRIARELRDRAVEILLGERFLGRDGPRAVRASGGRIEYRHLINTAGLYADKVARAFGAGRRYAVLPFKGLYLKYLDDGLVSRHVYPVPDMGNPFLGVHFTKTIDGGVKAGPTAVPAFWRENYAGLSNFRAGELVETLSLEARCFLKDSFGFRRLSFEEFKKYIRRHFIRRAAALVKRLDGRKFGGYLAPGIRAQLVDTEKLSLVDDFVVEEGENSTHVLNAVSPAFTCAFSFGGFVAGEVEKRLG